MWTAAQRGTTDHKEQWLCHSIDVFGLKGIAKCPKGILALTSGGDEQMKTTKTAKRGSDIVGGELNRAEKGQMPKKH